MCRAGISFVEAAASGVPQDDTEAVKFYRLAADQGNANAQFNLGNCYLNGRGVSQYDAAAVKWYRLAADQRDSSAQSDLGTMFSNGRGVPKDDVEAVKWWQLAANQGAASARLNLGVMYLRGQGAPRDEVRGLMWLILAALQGNQKAIEGRNLVSQDMTKAQIAESQKLAREWTPIKSLAHTTPQLTSSSHHCWSCGTKFVPKVAFCPACGASAVFQKTSDV